MTTINAILTDGSNVDMPALRTYLASLEASVAQANLAIATGTIAALVGTRTYATQAALYADLVPADDLFALVYADTDPLKNGLYQKDGATTAGDWDGPFDLFTTAAQALVQDLVDDAETASAAAAASSTTAQNAAVSLGNMLGRLVSGGVQVFNGGVKTGRYSWRIPTGQTGQTCIIQPKIAFDGSANAGRQIELTLGFTKSATFTRDVNIAMQVQLSGSTEDRVVTVTTQNSGNRRIIKIVYDVEGDELALQPYTFVGAGSATAADETLALTDFVIRYLSATGDTQRAGDQAMQALVDGVRRDAAGAASVPALIPHSTRFVAPSGAEYASPFAALASITDASRANRVKLSIAPARYASAEIDDVDFVDIAGSHWRDVILDGSQANSASEADLEANSTLFSQREGRITGVSIIGKNVRYAWHLESNNVWPDRKTEIIACHVEHFGNDDAGANTWGSQFAVGSGLSSGQVVVGRANRYQAKNDGCFTYHTNVNWTEPSHVDHEGEQFHCSDIDGFAYRILSLGSFQPDTCRLVGCTFGGDIVYGPLPWLPNTLAKCPANHAEITVYGHGNSPAVFDNQDYGKALKITSATTGGSSSIAVSGSAVAVIFGDGTTDRLTTVAGSAGFAGYVEGWGDISGVNPFDGGEVFLTALGKRLGDCTSANKTLFVTVDGGSPIGIPFVIDFTSMTNAEVIAFLNSYLGSAAVASESQPGKRYRPFFSDEEISAINTGATGIPMGALCAFDAHHRKVRLMTSADSASLFAGVAWEDIPVGRAGRVKSRGYLPIGDVLRTDSASFVFGDTFSIDPAAPGKVFKGGSMGLLKAIRSSAVKVA